MSKTEKRKIENDCTVHALRDDELNAASGGHSFRIDIPGLED